MQVQPAFRGDVGGGLGGNDSGGLGGDGSGGLGGDGSGGGGNGSGGLGGDGSGGGGLDDGDGFESGSISDFGKSTPNDRFVFARFSTLEQLSFSFSNPKKDNQFSAIMGESDDTQMLTRCREEGPHLLAVLKEMKDGLDVVRRKVEALILKVKQNQLPTENGISYLEAKHFLLLSYCQCAVYYLLRKAKGLSIEGHPVVRSLVEIRLFLEKIRPIDKKLEYQVQKFTRVAETTGAEKKMSVDMKKKDDSRGEEDPLKYRPNPDMLVSKSTVATQ
uniref:Neuroguidin n=1 Tax=Ananas comosus var. bracteatus TaxID=296719 RepID=A0A6V7Q8R1_ANACO|nr:unnamed protein product [Ananas comosus var. bracteatus]